MICCCFQLTRCCCRHNSCDPSMGDPDAPSDDGEPMFEQTWQEDINHVFQNINPEFVRAHQASQASKFDWVAHTANHYSDAIVAEAGKWCQQVSHAELERVVGHVDPDSLNADQAFIYRAVLEHDEKWTQRTPHQPCAPFAANDQWHCWIRQNISHPSYPTGTG